jgi:hypothetical protein
MPCEIRAQDCLAPLGYRRRRLSRLQRGVERGQPLRVAGSSGPRLLAARIQCTRSPAAREGRGGVFRPAALRIPAAWGRAPAPAAGPALCLGWGRGSLNISVSLIAYCLVILTCPSQVHCPPLTGFLTNNKKDNNHLLELF